MKWGRASFWTPWQTLTHSRCSRNGVFTSLMSEGWHFRSWSHQLSKGKQSLVEGWLPLGTGAAGAASWL